MADGAAADGAPGPLPEETTLKLRKLEKAYQAGALPAALYEKMVLEAGGVPHQIDLDPSGGLPGSAPASAPAPAPGPAPAPEVAVAQPEAAGAGPAADVAIHLPCDEGGAVHEPPHAPAPAVALTGAEVEEGVPPEGNQYVFGYGSLINSKSRGVPGAVSGEEGFSAPVVARGMRRTWGCHMDVEGTKWSALCCRQSPTPEVDECCGVVFAASAADLEFLDERELRHGCGYARTRISHEGIEPWMGVRDALTARARQVVDALSAPGAVLWAYMPAEESADEFPTVWYPVIQTYLDVTLMGCAEHGVEFAAAFLRTTLGWGTDMGSWTNDRETPRYQHLGSGAAVTLREEWDRVLQRRRPLAFSCRQDPSQSRVRGRTSSLASARDSFVDDPLRATYSRDSDESDVSSEDEFDDETPRSPGASGGGVAAEGVLTPVDEDDVDGDDGDGDGEPEPEPQEPAPSKKATVRVQDGKKWKAQFFAIEDGMFSVYEDDTEASLMACIPTELCTLSHPKSRRDDAPHAFRIDVDTGKSSSMSGWMAVQSGVRKHWKRRYFQIQLQGTELAFYEKPPNCDGKIGVKPKGTIDLQKCQKVEPLLDDVLVVDLLALQEGGKYVHNLLRCDNEDDCMMWINALSQCLAMKAANMDQQASGGIRVGKGFQKKYHLYIVDGVTEQDQTEWFEAFGGEVLERKMDGIRQWGQAVAKKIDGAAAEAAAALQKDDDGEGLDLELLTAADRSVMKLSIDGSVFSCSELAHGTTSAADPDSGDSYADPTAASFAALHQCIAMICPSFFGFEAVPQSPRASAAPTKSGPDPQLEKPVEKRKVSGAENPLDIPLLMWCEKVGYQRSDGGSNYKTAAAAYMDKGSDEWMAHVLSNEWPVEGGKSFVEEMREQSALLLHVPQCPASGDLRYSVRRQGDQLLVLASGDSSALLPQCTELLSDGGAQPMSSERLKQLTMLADTMCEPVADEAEDGGRAEPPEPEVEAESGADVAGAEPAIVPPPQPQVISFAWRRLDTTDFPAGEFEPQWDDGEANFPLDALIFLGHVCVSPYSKPSRTRIAELRKEEKTKEKARLMAEKQMRTSKAK